MIKSMTGYGKSIVEMPGRKLTIEVKTLNSKQLDLNVRLPYFYREKELEIRALASKLVERGKTDININYESTGEINGSVINQALALQYYNELKEFTKITGEKSIDYPAIIMRMPDVLKTAVSEISEAEFIAVIQGVEQSLSLADEFRISEGMVLKTDIDMRIELILKYLSDIEPLEKLRIPAIQEKLRKNLNELNEHIQYDPNRFEQELIFWLEKLDITEEKVRLRKHCDYFTEVINNEHSQGKKLGFIAQEIGREINTIGSKANDSQMQQIVVSMKDELEKIKEQLLNIL